MLEAKDLTLTLTKNGRNLVEQFDFILHPGDKVAIIGEEGNGKSTLVKYLYDPALVANYCEATGRVSRKGRLAYLPQQLPRALASVTLEDFFTGAELWRLPDELALGAAWVCSKQTLGTLSGGEKVKAQLAKLLLNGPDALLLDEPTNDLDIETLEWMERFLKSTPLPVLFISHDETLLRNTANVIVHMEQLRRKNVCRVTVVRTDYETYVNQRRLGFEKQSQIAQKQRDDYERQMARWRRIHERVEHEQNTIPRGDPHGGRLLKKKMASVLAQGRRFEREREQFTDFPDEEEAILSAFSQQIRLPRGKAVLELCLPELRVEERLLAKDVRLHVCGGAHIGITGRNGAGKSTLLAEIWRQIETRRDITPAYMPQNYAERLDCTQTPLEFLNASYDKALVERARTFLGSMRFTHEEMMGKIAALSGGQQAKLLFLDMVLREANVLVLDEPTRNFSPLSAPVIRAALRGFGGTIISVSHDRLYLSEVCDKVYALTQSGLKSTR